MEESEKQGSEFEDLVAWIKKATHPRAVVTANDKIRDRDTNRLRQIDVSIRLTEGPTEFLAIVEVRDRSRPVGVNYIEEVSQKRESVGADAVFVVSNADFYESAKKKAAKLNVRIFNFAEATSTDWKLFSLLKTMHVSNRRFDRADLSFADAAGKIIAPPQAVIDAVTTAPTTAFVENANGEPILSLQSIALDIVSQNGELLYGDVPRDGSRLRKAHIVRGPFSVGPLFIKDADGQRREVAQLRFQADLFVEASESSVEVSEMTRITESATTTVAQVAAAQVSVGDHQGRVELLATPDDAGGFRLAVRLVPRKAANEPST